MGKDVKAFETGPRLYIGGAKGGTGKSIVSLTLIDDLRRAGEANQIPAGGDAKARASRKRRRRANGGE